MGDQIVKLQIDEAHYDPSVTVIRDFGMTVERGEIVAVTGPSGQGKSTLLKIIAGLHAGYTGTVKIPEHARIAFIPQNRSLLPWKTVYHNIATLKKLHQRHVDKARVRELIRSLGLEDLESQYPERLSGGQYQRCALGRAFFMGPDVLLMDESFSSLDAETKREVQDVFLKLRAKTNMTTILVTHDMEEAAHLGSRIVEMKAV